MKIDIFYGSESGNSEYLCYDLEEEAKKYAECVVEDLDKVRPDEIKPGSLYVFVVSTHGDGDLAIPAEHFADRIRKQEVDFTGIQFAVFGLGDTVYEATYNWAAHKLAKLMTERNATLIGEIGLHDASDYDEPEDIGIPWFNGLMDQLAEKAA